jgi:hypothetical protein
MGRPFVLLGKWWPVYIRSRNIDLQIVEELHPRIETADQAFFCSNGYSAKSARAKSQHNVLRPRRAVVGQPVVIKSPPKDLLP